MKYLLCLALLLTTLNISAQRPDTVKGVPHYKLLTKDSTYVTEASLKKGRPTMIIYFAPDCSHCQRLTYEFQEEFKKEAKAGGNTLKHVQIVMATFAELRAIQVFYRDFDLVKYPNITVGTEGHTYGLLNFYHVSTTPYVAIYNKTGELSKTFSTVPKIEDIMAALKKM